VGAVLVGLYLAWWVVRIGVVNAIGDDDPFDAARLAPNHPQVRISLAMAYFLAQGGRVPDESRRAALNALKQAPLTAQPFFLAAVDAFVHGDDARGDRLLEEARRRDPRFRLTRLLLLDRYLREGRVPEAVVEMKTIDRLVAGATNALTAALAQMAQDPKTAPRMLPLLRRQPTLQEAVLESLVASGADASVVLSVAGPAARSARSAPWQADLLTRLVDKGQYGQARNLWQTFTGTREDERYGIYDSEFIGRPGPLPFNWKLATSGVGAAERAPGHSLQVAYYGREKGELASQLLMLRSGPYRLSFRATSDGSEDSHISWTIVCGPGEHVLLQLPIGSTGTAARQFTGTFIVPSAACPAQWLKLLGVPGDIEASRNVHISGLSIQPASRP
jgi:hypothetical protein